MKEVTEAEECQRPGGLISHKVQVELRDFALQQRGSTESFPVSQFFASAGQSIGVSASATVLLMNIQD